MTEHQFGLFGFNEMRPRTKVPISKERIEEVKRLMTSDPRSAAIVLSDIQGKLESYEQRIHNGQKACDSQGGK